MMSIKKSLLPLAMLALALMGFASTASAAVDGTVVDVETGKAITAGTKLHLVGWTEWANEKGDGFVCHVTSEVEATSDTTGTVTNYSIPDTTKCKGTNALAQCKLKGHEVTNLPYHATVTPPDEATKAGQIDITGSIVIHEKLEGFLCPAEITWTFSEIIWKPLKTGVKVVTGTNNKLGETAVLNDPIAGFEERGNGESHSVLGTDVVQVTGELELTAENSSHIKERCTWKIVKAA